MTILDLDTTPLTVDMIKAPSTYTEIANAVDSTGGVIALPMEALREAEGKGRLGVHVLAKIRAELNSRGLSTFPLDLPNSQTAMVRVYRQGSQVGKAVSAVLFPSHAGDEVLRGLSSDDNAQKIEEIRAILG